MNLRDYLAANRVTQAEFAKRLNVSQGLVWQWLNGRTIVTAERALEIESVTSGQVTRLDLRPDLFALSMASNPEAQTA